MSDSTAAQHTSQHAAPEWPDKDSGIACYGFLRVQATAVVQSTNDWHGSPAGPALRLRRQLVPSWAQLRHSRNGSGRAGSASCSCCICSPLQRPEGGRDFLDGSLDHCMPRRRVPPHSLRPAQRDRTSMSNAKVFIRVHLRSFCAACLLNARRAKKGAAASPEE